MENLEGIGRILSYIITVVIGGVGFKYYKLWIETNTTNKQIDSSSNQNLIENLENRLKLLGDRTEQLEELINSYHKREIDFTRQLAKAETKVEMLEKRVQSLEEKNNYLQKVNEKYYEQYGDVNE